MKSAPLSIELLNDTLWRVFSDSCTVEGAPVPQTALCAGTKIVSTTIADILCIPSMNSVVLFHQYLGKCVDFLRSNVKSLAIVDFLRNIFENVREISLQSDLVYNFRQLMMLHYNAMYIYYAN